MSDSSAFVLQRLPRSRSIPRSWCPWDHRLHLLLTTRGALTTQATTKARFETLSSSLVSQQSQQSRPSPCHLCWRNSYCCRHVQVPILVGVTITNVVTSKSFFSLVSQQLLSPRPSPYPGWCHNDNIVSSKSLSLVSQQLLWSRPSFYL